MEGLVIAHHGEIVVRSTEVAKHFGKRHDHVMQDIERLLRGVSEQPNLSGSEFFFESKFTNDRNREYREYLMSRDGFALLAMGFTGEKALAWKLKYISAFKQMESALLETGKGVMDSLGEAIYLMELDKEKASAHGKALSIWRKVRKSHIDATAVAYEKAQMVLNFKPS